MLFWVPSAKKKLRGVSPLEEVLRRSIRIQKRSKLMRIYFFGLLSPKTHEGEIDSSSICAEEEETAGDSRLNRSPSSIPVDRPSCRLRLRCWTEDETIAPGSRLFSAYNAPNWLRKVGKHIAEVLKPARKFSATRKRILLLPCCVDYLCVESCECCWMRRLENKILNDYCAKKDLNFLKIF